MKDVPYENIKSHKKNKALPHFHKIQFWKNQKRG